ncbi:ABC transporter permease [Clostridium formicaceticum]|uniref:ABC transporter permease n=1 Tax=Clostridium formicaceticum TaxID=1497 RepID=A0AAC9RL39_9CLOT|nr:ABC-2 transporter permease [Clostridium formicaceticum]AOY77136.1 ABC transporter permease [Clostridium formicaceticum]ARE87652.1 ABC-2 family transporter protein [Clostridium formicaceticum]
MSKQFYYHTGKLVALILRRDRIRIPIWFIALSLFTIALASSFPGLYPTVQERQAIAATMLNPAMIAMLGPGFGLEDYTFGAMMAHQMLLFTAIAVAIMSILLVTRHTRADEEGGHIEMIRSLPVGRLSNLSATIYVLFGTNVLLALVIGFGLYGLGIEGMDLEGSLLYGAALGATGIFFTAITALFAQLAENSRGTIGFSFGILGVTYLIRAIGDVSNETLSWFSPLGWILRAEAYVNNYWWPVLLTVAVGLVILILAFYLNAVRDLGAGLIPAKPGRRNASVFLQSPLGLALRLQRTAMIAWGIGLFILGISYGSVLGDLEAFFAGNEMMRELLTPMEGFSLTEQYLTMLMTVISMMCTIPALIMILKLKGEEIKHRTEYLLAAPISRRRLMRSYLLISIIFGFFVLLFAVIGLWSAGTAVMDEPISFDRMFTAAMVYLPAMWVMIGVVVFFIGLLPQVTSLVWFYLGYSFFVVYLGGLLQFSDLLTKLSPFGHVPKVPIEDINFTPIFIMTAIAVMLTMIGFIGYKHRDIEG